MDMWNVLEWLAWAVSAVLGLTIIVDWLRTDSRYTEEQLSSSREGELEALTEQHKMQGAIDG